MQLDKMLFQYSAFRMHFLLKIRILLLNLGNYILTRKNDNIMKKLFFLLVSLFVAISSHAITLFPHFVDIAGNYKEGSDLKFTELNIPVKQWNVNPSFYKTISEAEEFLQDTLPFSTYSIGKDTQTLPDGTIIIKYSASLADGIFGPDETMAGKWSYLYLIQTPGEPLYVGIYEDEP